MFKRSVLLAVRVVVLSAIYCVVFVITSGTAYQILNLAEPEPGPDAGSAFAALVAVSVLNTLVVAIAGAR